MSEPAHNPHINDQEPEVIKFSQDYIKMPDGYEKSGLLEVFITCLNDLSPEFVEYDTYIVNAGNQPLPSGKLLVLLLQTIETDEVWTATIRWTVEAEQYYRRLRGTVVKCEIVPAGG